MYDTLATSSDQILTSLNCIIDYSNVVAIVSLDKELALEDLVGINGVEKTVRVNEDVCCPLSVSGFIKTKMHDLILKDHWVVSNETMSGNNALYSHVKAIC